MENFSIVQAWTFDFIMQHTAWCKQAVGEQFLVYMTWIEAHAGKTNDSLHFSDS